MTHSENIYNDNTYLEKNTNWHEDDSIWKYNHIKSMISKISYNSVVDVGCGAGKILELFQNDFSSKEFYGYDISQNLQNFWDKRNPQIKFFSKNILEMEIKYDLLLLIDVFEHVEDYYMFLRKLNSKSNYFIFHIPLDMFVLASLTNNYKQKKASVGHLHYFDHNTALSVLEDTGYKVIDFKLTKAYLQSKTKLNKMLSIIRKIGSCILGNKLNSRIFGGYSMMVLCEKQC